MRWRGRAQSENVDDRRGRGPQMAIGGGGSLIVVIIFLAMKFLGAPPEAQRIAGEIAQQVQQNQQRAAPAGNGIDDDVSKFVRVVLRDTEEIWAQLFEAQVDGSYIPPRLVLFSGSIGTKCGTGQAAMGPFYCPMDRKIYIDPSFFDDLARRHSAPGDFAQAYVIAHEVAHHVQNLLGFSTRIRREQAQRDKAGANRLSVRLELQADYLAGVWAHHAHKEFSILEEGDMEEAIQAANQIGDDTLQRQATGTVIPERFTHGTSAQRVRWFKKGFSGGDLSASREILSGLAYDQL